MYPRPFLDEVQSAPWQLPFEDVQRGDVDGRFELPVSCMEMRRRWSLKNMRINMP